ncbi:hypothetical protein HanXRQr2_Chr15g0687821 [Helianthus annuus]|uniref:Uncharacterized protein n=1 Tax=Helianthus annuus TaxID=4232 RepID=A0A251S8J2_HELAN|nr:uncharacterized protein LOC110909610 [Helianthus annuus]KAF5764078.1 hypothetical protein HanXRQr2_Chr15g0687821 [Helianthus annuus]KAJ0830816.1 hypothetical protein HanPSC8_Chr15g0659801 [Helianthus annuus]
MKHTLMELFTIPEELAAFKHDKEEEPEKSKKLVNVPTLASIESLTFPLVQEVVVLADHRCKMSQDRVADIVSRLNGDMESMEIMMMEKKTTLTFICKHSKATKTIGKKLEVITVYKSTINKISNAKRFLRSSFA